MQPTIIGTNVNEGSAFVPLGANGAGVNQTLADAVGMMLFLCPSLKSALYVKASRHNPRVLDTS